MNLKREDLTALKAPFNANDHEFLNGMAYLNEFAVTNRIEDIDPAWSFVIRTVQQRDSVGTKNEYSVTVVADLTIKGVTRTGIGMATARATKSYTDKATGELVSGEANEAEKSAATDALKRAARLFGVGRYLLKLPRNISDVTAMDTWLKKMLEAKKQFKQAS